MHLAAARAGGVRLCRFLTAAALVVAAAIAPARAQMPQDFVYLRDIDPTIAQDMRYAGSDNFVGRPLPGYDAPECILRRETALALQKVQADLAASGYALKVYDCYRPTRAVRAMWQWAHDGGDGAATKRFFPYLDKRTLFASGYIATHSRHSTGSTVDLTIIALQGAAAPGPGAAKGPCTAPIGERAPDDSIDMGTGFDCFDERSRTASAAIGEAQKLNRRRLVEAMKRRGFRNYAREWWHFSLAGGSATTGFDFPIRPRAAGRG
jgi:D-alanyl-D-alanine dipeptidase